MEGLTGLVLCGGISSRMGTDKGLITYHDLPQRYHVYKLLAPFCGKVWIVGNQLQESDIDPAYNFIKDSPNFTGHGPMTALLTAFEKLPHENFIVIGCDYPTLNADDIFCLASNRNEQYDAVSYFDEAENVFEPLLAIYENSIREKLAASFSKGQYSLQQLLAYSTTKKIIATEKIKSVDTPEEMQEMINKFRRFI
jgi:molybdopterin-guanine dinucleotide biosynthesis protein A